MRYDGSVTAIAFGIFVVAAILARKALNKGKYHKYISVPSKSMVNSMFVKFYMLTFFNIISIALTCAFLFFFFVLSWETIYTVRTGADWQVSLRLAFARVSVVAMCVSLWGLPTFIKPLKALNPLGGSSTTYGQWVSSFHQIFGVVAFYAGLVHGIWLYASGSRSTNGIIALSLLTAGWLTAALVRNHRLFRWFHLLFPAALYFTILHVAPKKNPAASSSRALMLYMLYISVGALVLDRVAEYLAALLTSSGRWTVDRAEQIDREHILLHLRAPNADKPSDSAASAVVSHAPRGYLSVLAPSRGILGIPGSAFTLVPPSATTNSYRLFIKKSSTSSNYFSLTRHLFASADDATALRDASDGLVALGPYGESVHETDLRTACRLTRSMVLVAGGSGITFVLSTLNGLLAHKTQLLASSPSSASSFPHVSVVWAVRSLQVETRFKEEIQALLKLINGHDDPRTSASSALMVFNTFTGERPDVPALLDARLTQAQQEQNKAPNSAIGRAASEEGVQMRRQSLDASELTSSASSSSTSSLETDVLSVFVCGPEDLTHTTWAWAQKHRDAVFFRRAMFNFH